MIGILKALAVLLTGVLLGVLMRYVIDWMSDRINHGGDF